LREAALRASIRIGVSSVNVENAHVHILVDTKVNTATNNAVTRDDRRTIARRKQLHDERRTTTNNNEQ